MKLAWTIARAVDAGIGENIRNALDEQFYKQLKKRFTGYKKVTIIKYSDHLNEKWTKLTNKAKRDLKAKYYCGWQQPEHITEFIRRLEEDQQRLEDMGIPIYDDDIYEHFVEEMYKSNCFSSEK